MTKQEAIQALDTLVEAYGIALRAIRDSMDAGESAEGVRCDCSHSGPCCNYSDNKGCNHQKENGSCRVPFRNAKLDRSQWEGCGYCSNPEDAETNEFLFCPYCGNPITEEAWAELDMRIGGHDGM